MNKTYIEISIPCREQERDPLVGQIARLGCMGFLETDAGLLCYFDQGTWNDEKMQILAGLLPPEMHPDIREIREENWNERWERSIEPVEVGSRFAVVPSWCRYANSGGRIVISIDPKMSFGTGHHESTRLAITLLERHFHPGWTLLDVGTGTGILAIAAAKLGAKGATGIDTDGWAVSNARENVIANGLEDKVVISDEPVRTFSGRSFDCIAANLSYAVISDLLACLHELLRPGGILILAGLLSTDRSSMTRDVAGAGLMMMDECSENEWIALAVRRLS